MIILSFSSPSPRAERILQEVKANPNAACCLQGLFDFRPEPPRSLLQLFDGEIDLLKQAYLASCATERHLDYEGGTFGEMLDADPGFAVDYLRWIYSKERFPSLYRDSRDYAFLWRREDAEDVVRSILREELKLAGGASLSPVASVFFVGVDNQERQMSFLLREIEASAGDVEYMGLIFGVARSLSAGQRRQLVETFVAHNQDFEAFETLYFEPQSQSWSGSEVPLLQARIDFYQSLLSIFDSVPLLRHRQRIEQTIQGLQEEIKRATRDDFLDDVR